MIIWLKEKLAKGQSKLEKVKNKLKKARNESKDLKKKVEFLEKLIIEKDNNEHSASRAARRN